MTVVELASEIARPLLWSPHDGSFPMQIAENLLAKYDLIPKVSEPVVEQVSDEMSDEDPGETAAWPA